MFLVKVLEKKPCSPGMVDVKLDFGPDGTWFRMFEREARKLRVRYRVEVSFKPAPKWAREAASVFASLDRGKAPKAGKA